MEELQLLNNHQIEGRIKRSWKWNFLLKKQNFMLHVRKLIKFEWKCHSLKLCGQASHRIWRRWIFNYVSTSEHMDFKLHAEINNKCGFCSIVINQFYWIKCDFIHYNEIYINFQLFWLSFLIWFSSKVASQEWCFATFCNGKHFGKLQAQHFWGCVWIMPKVLQ